eukprot:GHVO01035577.1.p1 GENE.GHVO01035577.1~~GHVO01035577.1.p1  ORF type:complete len:105 (+),score=1.87 GHVO01035577.1:216-530(+)
MEPRFRELEDGQPRMAKTVSIFSQHPSLHSMDQIALLIQYLLCEEDAQENTITVHPYNSIFHKRQPFLEGGIIYIVCIQQLVQKRAVVTHRHGMHISRRSYLIR